MDKDKKWVDSEEAQRFREEAKELGLPDTYQVFPQMLKAHKANTLRNCTDDELVSKLVEMAGNVTLVANFYGVARQTVLRWLKNDGNLHMLDEIDDSWTDIAEHQLNNAVLNGAEWAVKFRLKTKGKSRGYFEQTEHNITQTIKVQLESDGTNQPLGETEE